MPYIVVYGDDSEIKEYAPPPWVVVACPTTQAKVPFWNVYGISTGYICLFDGPAGFPPPPQTREKLVAAMEAYVQAGYRGIFVEAERPERDSDIEAVNYIKARYPQVSVWWWSLGPLEGSIPKFDRAIYQLVSVYGVLDEEKARRCRYYVERGLRVIPAVTREALDEDSWGLLKAYGLLEHGIAFFYWATLSSGEKARLKGLLERFTPTWLNYLPGLAAGLTPILFGGGVIAAQELQKARVFG